MNVNDIKQEAPWVEDKLIEMFKKQRLLMGKYEGIELSNGLLQTPEIPVSLDDNKGQARLKDFFWRVTEEIAEAIEAYFDDELDHFHEELSDALHFYIEVMILSGAHPEQFRNCPTDMDLLELIFTQEDDLSGEMIDKGFNKGVLIKQLAVDVIIWMGLAANCLKNKPWKQTHMKTDREKYEMNLLNGFHGFIRLCKCAGFDANSLYNMYFKKNEVNKFRQESKY
jgi:hypothetical protein